MSGCVCARADLFPFHHVVSWVTRRGLDYFGKEGGERKAIASTRDGRGKGRGPGRMRFGPGSVPE